MGGVIGSYVPVCSGTTDRRAESNADKFSRLCADHPRLLGNLSGVVRSVGLRDPNHIDDVVQHALEQGLLSVHRFDESRDEGTFVSWMATLTRRSAYQKLNRDKREVPIDGDGFMSMERIQAARNQARVQARSPDDVVAPLPESLRAKIPHVHDALDSLPASLQPLARMCLLEGRNEADVAKELGLSSWTEVHSGVMRARALLRRRLEDQPGVGEPPGAGEGMPQRLPPRQQEIWRLDREGFTPTQIAERLSIQPTSVKAILRQIRRFAVISPREQELLHLSDERGLNKDEIAQLTGLKPNSVVTVLVRARKKVQGGGQMNSGPST